MQSEPLICPGCKADLSKAISMLLNIMWGRLAVKCPLCNYVQNVKIAEDGKVQEVKEE